jgi:hypothetical protein
LTVRGAANRLALSGVPPTFRDNMRRFEALGLEIKSPRPTVWR